MYITQHNFNNTNNEYKKDIHNNTVNYKSVQM